MMSSTGSRLIIRRLINNRYVDLYNLHESKSLSLDSIVVALEIISILDGITLENGVIRYSGDLGKLMLFERRLILKADLGWKSSYFRFALTRRRKRSPWREMIRDTDLRTLLLDRQAVYKHIAVDLEG